ncbi:MAG: hypothetical protein Q9170_000020 [Blastenia crenularia]
MVHYVRFLRSPRFDLAVRYRGRVLLRGLITITTDLGDSFYPSDLCLYTAIVTRNGRISLASTTWKPGMRCLKVEIKVPLEYLTLPAKFLFTCDETLETDSLKLGKVPHIISAWTEEFRGHQDSIADVVVRRFTVQEGKVLDIPWLICNKELMWQPDEQQSSIIELGTGCGLVGLVLGSMRHNSRLILTDVDDGALKLAKENAQISREMFNSTWECRSLDWTEPQKFVFNDKLTLIVASECIYNSDSIPLLVQTMSDLVQRSIELRKESPGPKIVVSTKRRHDSEAMFFTMMIASGFEETVHAIVPLHDRYRESVGIDLEVVNIYIFQRRAIPSPDAHGGILLEWRKGPKQTHQRVTQHGFAEMKQPLSGRDDVSGHADRDPPFSVPPCV